MIILYLLVNYLEVNEMADKTFGVKVSEEMYEKAKLVIDASGVSSKDWFEKAIALYEMNSIKQGSSDYTQDLTELEHHTTRMYELIVNMIQRSVYLKDSAVKDVANKLESKEAIINDLQQKTVTFKAELAIKNEETEGLQKQLKQLEENFETNQTMLDNNQALIIEYKEKNDVLNGLVAQYKKYGDENEALKAELREVQTTLTTRAINAEQQANELAKNLEDSIADAQKAQTQYKENLQMSIEKKDLERQKALLDFERLQQEKLFQLSANHNEGIRSLYDQIEELRKTNEQNREKYQAEIEALKKQKDK